MAPKIAFPYKIAGGRLSPVASIGLGREDIFDRFHVCFHERSRVVTFEPVAASRVHQ